MEVIIFTEDDIFNQINRFASLDGRAMPKTGKGAKYRTGKCTRCGEPSYPYALCRRHREHGSIKRVIDGLVEDEVIERVTDGRGRKGGATYRRGAKWTPPVVKKPFVRGSEKTGRNDRCLCGSEKKYKHCCNP